MDAEDKTFEVYQAPPEDILQQPMWTPRSKSYQKAMQELKSLEIPSVGELFNVQQGARTGRNPAFIVSAEAYQSYKSKERVLFRPIAATSTIRNGRLTPKSYVFFPYNSAGLRLTTEDQVKKAVPTFYHDVLLPNKEALLQRARIPATTWWRLTHEREWQREPNPKLVSAYFGQRGKFAFDDSGQYVVTQGFAWNWKREPSDAIELEDPADLHAEAPPPVSFYQSLLPFAYLSLLNSEVFERFLSFVCPIMQGGQFDLSALRQQGLYPRSVQRNLDEGHG